MEVLFVDGMSTDRTRNIVSEYTKQYSHIRLIDNPHKIVPCAMNIGIRASKGDVIIRLDAHASYQPDYFLFYIDIRVNFVLKMLAWSVEQMF